VSDSPRQDDLFTLEAGTLHSFADWPNPEVPRIACGVYTVWLPDGGFLYVGMSGRGATLDPNSPRRKGLWTRLNSHASGRRSGDQFCVYVCDRLIVPHLTRQQQREIGAGVVSLDTLTCDFIRANLGYRYVVTADAAAAFAVERAVKGGALGAGKPLLNPSA
jgi:hypothetical protein